MAIIMMQDVKQISICMTLFIFIIKASSLPIYMTEFIQEYVHCYDINNVIIIDNSTGKII